MQNIDLFFDPAKAFLIQIGAFLPRLAFAVLLLIAGWLLAKVVRFAVEKALRAINFRVLTERSGMDEFLQRGGSRRDTTALFGLLAFWLIMFSALVITLNGLGLTHASDLLGRLILFLPKIAVALLILSIGAYFARSVRNTVLDRCKNAGIQDADFLSKVAQYAVMTFVILIALDQTNIGGDIVREAFLIILTGIVLAFALAFGLGGKNWAAGLLERWWPTAQKPGER